VLGGLKGLKGLQRLPAPYATLEQITRIHAAEFWEGMKAQEPSEGRIALEPDTYLNNGSIDATLRASGGLCFAIDQVLSDKALNAFCAVRPPGHHSGPEHAMGFCLLNHVAIGAMHALENPNIKRVAIVDFDVHHGNGTQAAFAQNPDVMFVSSHQMPLYPGTGSADETGCGNILNLPLAAGDDGKAFRRLWSQKGLPAIHDFDPDLILVSAGFDAQQRDPLAQLELEDADYRWITEEISDLATDSCQGRVVSILEGGYDLQALATASRSHVQGLAS
jgi:acetoin utilization deacetylase AcuC-like enzyme